MQEGRLGLGNLYDELVARGHMPPVPDPHWWEYPGELAAFLRYLVSDHEFTLESVIHVVDNPRKWTEEYDLWKARQK
jgi:hypothetical protein